MILLFHFVNFLQLYELGYILKRCNYAGFFIESNAISENILISLLL